jgi:eukaryotic-like serine/threonine-protein kinase
MNLKLGQNNLKKFFLQALPYGLLFWIILLPIMFLLVDQFLMPYFSGHYKEVAQVPDVAYMQPNQAEHAIRQSGLLYSWLPEGRFSADAPKGTVLYQQPIAGRMVKHGRTVNLTLSLGRREVTIPDIRGQSKRQGEVTMHQLGLAIKAFQSIAHSEIPAGAVVRTIPPAEAIVQVGDSITVILSSGVRSGRVALPEFSGLSLDNAENLIQQLGLQVGNIYYEEDSLRLPNTVISQNPSPGEQLSINSRVSLVVSK